MLILKLFFKYFGKMFSGLFRFLGIYAKILPFGMTTLFIASKFIQDLVFFNLPFAFKNMSISIFSAELVINRNVHLALANSIEYGFFAFIHILISLYVLYALVKFITMLLITATGSQAKGGAMLFSIVIVGIISISSIAVVEKNLGFIPIKDSIIFLALNIKPVLLNVFTAGTTTIAPQIINNTINSTMNSTISAL